MYIDETFSTDDDTALPPRKAIIGRFEGWLRSHGFEPDRDPFCPLEICYEVTENATKLVDEYLRDKPAEQTNRKTLMKHASEIGEVAAAWGHNGCGLAAVFEEMDAGASTKPR